MDTGTLAAREQNARQKVNETAARIATSLGIDPKGLDATHREPRLKALFQLEALVPVLEAIETAVSQETVSRAQIAAIALEIPGLTKTSKDAIKKWAKEA